VATTKTEKIAIENVNRPGHVRSIDADMYAALPKTSPGLTSVEIQEGVLAYLPEELFPEGAKAGWWTKGSAKEEAPTERAGARQAKSQDDDLSANVLPGETKPEAFA
jgi:hypothetical protein